MSEDRLRPYAEHLEFLGYTCNTDGGSWMFATHAVRWNFWLKPFDHGTRLHCTIEIGLLSDARLRASLEFINRINEKSFHAKFTLAPEDSGGSYCVRVRSVASPRYDRREFGMWLDMWHKDLELLIGGPWFAEQDEEEEEESEERPGVSVN